MSKWHGGKGSTQRPRKVSKEKFDQNWDRIFKKDKEDDKQTNASLAFDELRTVRFDNGETE